MKPLNETGVEAGSTHATNTPTHPSKHNSASKSTSRQKNQKAKTAKRLLIVCTMPPLPHWPDRTKPFDPRNSEVCRWLVAQPACSGLRHADLRQKPEYTAEDLFSKWNSQKDRCAITGLIIVPGDTAALDHIVPIARGGSSKIDNLRFVHRIINHMKWDMIDAELKEFINQAVGPLLQWALDKK